MLSYRPAIALLLAAAVVVAGCQKKPQEPAATQLNDDQKAIYAFGIAVGRQMSAQTKQLQLTADEIKIFKDGFADALADKAADFDVNAYEERFRKLAEGRIAKAAEDRRKAGAEFLAKAAKEQGATTTASGLVYRSIKAGTGPKPKATDTVKVNYEGTLPDGKVFDSSIKRGQPAEFALDRVIPCWTEAVQLMQVGEKARIVCPSALAYGERGAGNDIPADSTLAFDVELLEIKGSAPAAAAQ